MSSGENDYKEWQERYEDLYEEYDEDWSDEQKCNHYENMAIANEEELQDRLAAREEWEEYGEDNEGHDHRIDRLRDQGQLLQNDMAHARGEYEYQREGIQDMDGDLRRELEEENNALWGYNANEEGSYGDDNRDEEEESSDMDICDLDSD